MRRLAAASLSAGTLALAACGSTVVTSAAVPASTGPAAPASASADAPPACTAIAHAEMAAVTRRIYDQAVSGRNETAARGRLDRSAALADAVAAHDPAAVRAALAPLRKHQITRIDVTGGGRTLARLGRTPAFAPVKGTIVARGRVVGHYVMAVSSQAAFRGLVQGLTGATVRFGPSPQPRATTSLPATLYPTGRTRISLTLPAIPSSLCGATAGDTRLNTIGLVARNVMAGEEHSAATLRTVRHIALDPAFRSAVAARDPAAVRAAIIGFFRDNRFHIVRVRAWSGARLINDVGGPYVLSPAVGTVHGAGGSTVGRFMVAVQDDTGLIKLVHRFTGADVVLHTGAGSVPGSNLMPGPPFTQGLGTVTYAGRTYRSLGLTGTMFPAGQLDVSLLVR